VENKKPIRTVTEDNGIIALRGIHVVVGDGLPLLNPAEGARLSYEAHLRRVFKVAQPNNKWTVMEKETT